MEAFTGVHCRSSSGWGAQWSQPHASPRSLNGSKISWSESPSICLCMQRCCDHQQCEYGSLLASCPHCLWVKGMNATHAQQRSRGTDLSTKNRVGKKAKADQSVSTSM